MGTENQKKKEKNKNTFLCKKGNHISQALLGTKFDCTDTETILLFCLKLILAKS